MHLPPALRYWLQPWRLICLVALLWVVSSIAVEHMLRDATQRQALVADTGETVPVVIYDELVLATDTSTRHLRAVNARWIALALAIAAGTGLWGHLRQFASLRHETTTRTRRWHLTLLACTTPILLACAVFGLTLTALALMSVPVHDTRAGDRQVIEASWMLAVILACAAISYVALRLEAAAVDRETTVER